MSEQSNKNVKKRNWVCIVYPDSAPSNWQEMLQKTGLQCAISPLHDKDTEEDGVTLKKPHWHVILCYSGPTSFNVVKRLTDTLNAPIPQGLESIRGQYRYFTHQDNPDKFQYNFSDIKSINGFNIADYVELTKSEVMIIKKELQALIRDLDFIEYSDFMDYLCDNDTGSWYEVASNNTYFFDRYITSKRNKMITMGKQDNEIN